MTDMHAEPANAPTPDLGAFAKVVTLSMAALMLLAVVMSLTATGPALGDTLEYAQTGINNPREPVP